MAWVLVWIAGCFEVSFALGLKYSEGFTKLVPSVIGLGSGLVSFLLLTVAMKSLSVGSAYAVWTGIGAAGTVLVGIIVLGDSASPGRLVAVGFVLVGVVGLRLAE